MQLDLLTHEVNNLLRTRRFNLPGYYMRRRRMESGVDDDGPVLPRTPPPSGGSVVSSKTAQYGQHMCNII